MATDGHFNRGALFASFGKSQKCVHRGQAAEVQVPARSISRNEDLAYHHTKELIFKCQRNASRCVDHTIVYLWYWRTPSSTRDCMFRADEKVVRNHHCDSAAAATVCITCGFDPFTPPPFPFGAPCQCFRSSFPRKQNPNLE